MILHGLPEIRNLSSSVEKMLSKILSSHVWIKMIILSHVGSFLSINLLPLGIPLTFT